MRASHPLLALGAAAGAFVLVARGAVTVDLGIGRELSPLGPRHWDIAATRETVFDVIAAPYLGKTPRALSEKLQVWERGTDMVLAAHWTSGRFGPTTTVETVRFERPGTIEFRLLRGPVPHVTESFRLDEHAGGTRLVWQGELGTDFWWAGRLWGGIVARKWEQAVADSLEGIKAEAERRA